MLEGCWKKSVVWSDDPRNCLTMRRRTGLAYLYPRDALLKSSRGLDPGGPISTGVPFVVAEGHGQ